jgi:uncharacterized protein YkwD
MLTSTYWYIAYEKSSVLADNGIQIVTNDSKATHTDNSTNDIDQLRLYALKLINQDRQRFNLSSLELSENNAAQLHAQELFEIKSLTPSHISLDGLKPYMAYSKSGGKGFSKQNVAIAGYNSSQIKKCINIQCTKINPYEEIARTEWNMVNNDTICCSNEHKQNILDKQHTHVSIGIAYDDYYFSFVQNFENIYLNLSNPVTYDNRHPDMVGNFLSDSQKYEINSIGVYYDENPSKLNFSDEVSSKSYGLGRLVGLVVKPPQLFTKYQKSENYTLIIASIWKQNDTSFEVRYDLPTDLLKSGVYTFIVYIGDSKKNIFPALSYSVFR